MTNKFTDAAGREWLCKVTVGTAIKLKDAGIDVDRLLSKTDNLLATLATDPILLVKALEILTEDQRTSKQIDLKSFLNELDGPALDAALDAFLEGVKNSLGKLKRPALEAAIPRLSKMMEETSKKMKTEVEKALDKAEKDLLAIGAKSTDSPE